MASPPPPPVRSRTRPRPDPRAPIHVERAPWSQIGTAFALEWGKPQGRFDPEHVEFLGPTGAGKTFAQAVMLKQRVAARQSHAVLICTKPADSTIKLLGWPVVDRIKDVAQYPQVVYWPKTRATGMRRKAFHAAKVQELLDWAWVHNHNSIIAFDEVAYVERLDPEIRADVEMYLREARSSGITLMMGKQRPQGVNREMHAETKWVVAFQGADRQDNERVAELFGSKRQWVEVLEDLDAEKYEFLIQNRRTKRTYISWIDRKPVKARPAA